MKKREIISIFMAGSLILSTVSPTFVSASELPEGDSNQIDDEPVSFMLRANVPVDNSGVTAPAASAGHYLYSSKLTNKSIKYQNREQAVNAIGAVVAGLATGYGGLPNVATAISILGGGGAITQLISGKVGAQFPVQVGTYVYLADSKHRTQTYAGYRLVIVKNANTGKTIKSTKYLIAKTGI
ncbi:hypothetical protein [Listeria newyorkensis]|uniref:Glycine zipper 2TM domain-containing protein n=1 Tax=Listeria newyorkensis TaxID=1497681 RepID=A0A841YVK1_9LIST|nr:hypothetical protein [Listeria newyorkensis]MBC1457831.1 hypothetical protein [Listeria newyorkensis]